MQKRSLAIIASVIVAAVATVGFVLILSAPPATVPSDGGPKQPPVSAPPDASRACRKTGCSGQVCAEEDVATDCMFRPEYACYRDAECARQADGGCGWTMTVALQSCLQDPPAE